MYTAKRLKNISLNDSRWETLNLQEANTYDNAIFAVEEKES